MQIIKGYYWRSTGSMGAPNLDLGWGAETKASQRFLLCDSGHAAYPNAHHMIHR